MKTFAELGIEIAALPSKHRQKIIAIDGGGGAGKSTFAMWLRPHLHFGTIIHLDDFYRGPWNARIGSTDFDVNPLFDWVRFETEVLTPLQEGRDFSYHIYDWHNHTSDNEAHVLPEATIILEGGAALQEKYVDIYDFKIWIEAPESERLAKALVRDGEHMRFLWEEDWLPIERNYIARQNPAARADLVVVGHEADFEKGSFNVI